MTKSEIIKAAYKTWGREFYLNTSLSSVAKELNVCKPALYRHFKNKEALLDAMTMHFIDSFTDFIRSDYEKSLECKDKSESVFTLTRSVAEYYARNIYIFIFSMIKLHNHELDSPKTAEELRKRGVDLVFFHHSIKKDFVFQPIIMNLIFGTLTFFMAGFHKAENSFVNPPSEKAIEKIINAVNAIIKQGLGYCRDQIDALDYKELEKRIEGTITGIEDDPLLKAVAEAVAEAGPWEASMEQVAQHSKLSKSSLYCHFKSKQDMLYRFFNTESLRIIEFARQGIRQSAIPQEQLYLGIFSVVEYLRKKPAILITLDWLRTRRLNFKPEDANNGKTLPEILFLFEEIDIKPLRGKKFPFEKIPVENGSKEKKQQVSPWILFLIIKTLMRKISGQALGNVPNSDVRALYRFLTLGIESFRIGSEQ